MDSEKGIVNKSVFLKTLCGGRNKIWAGLNGGSVKEISLADHKHSADHIISGVLPIERGGIGVTTIEELKTLLGTMSYQICHGIVHYANSQSERISFDKPFADIPSVVATFITDFPFDGKVCVERITTSSFTIHMSSITTGTPCNWIAVGPSS